MEKMVDDITAYERGYKDCLAHTDNALMRVERLERLYHCLAAGWSLMGALIVGIVWIATS